ncbi:MAG: 4-hydroxy-3-methylbut-2-en-1-yl diphosphate synthase (ferredoxin) [Chlamydiae bacterium]|nr:4-hydroxy-3-methylbut-2-en-1-yl diphosphate synthase (ferredoxin) [Chlamydiota bacterium]
MKYCESTYKSKRWKTREVKVGNVGVGGDNPIRIQSMTTSDTRDVEATVEQIIRLADSGCEIARVTVQGMKEADACEGIKNTLVQKGYDIPLVADIHFYPPAAMRVVDFVDKVRVNPGNFVDRRATFRTIEYDDATYAEEIEKIEEKFSPLVEKCIKLKRAMRIGTNHGSLSDRIMNRYGDTPFGMVESALEFARVCRKLDYHDFMFSMKASNPVVMIQAYRLLVAEMMKIGWDYPLHLGVTEAGEGEDGRIKSSVGTGSLLLDGIGETIRVSLTEDPWEEIDPCRRLVAFAEEYLERGTAPFEETTRDIEAISLRGAVIAEEGPLHRDGSVFLHVSRDDVESPTFFEDVGCKVQLGRPERTISTVDALIYEGEETVLPEKLARLEQMGVAILTRTPNVPGTIRLVNLSEVTGDYEFPCAISVDGDDWQKLLTLQPEVVLFSGGASRLHEGRQFFEWLKVNECTHPVLLDFSYDLSVEDFVIRAATECGALLADKLGEGVALRGGLSLAFLHSFSFGLLQACRMRSSKTEFISCPGCGRTLFDLQEVSKRIREKTAHLPGVKIAIMGCIVNGPGEMADADFGYVGSRPGMIDLYVGKTCVEKGIAFEAADERLIELIKTHDRWVEPEKVLI